MKVSTSFYIFSLLFITFYFAASFPEERVEDKGKITQSFTKHFDGDSEAQSRLFWGSYWKNKATASIQRLKEALDRLSENIRELTDKRFFFGGNKQSDEPSDTKDDEDAKNDDAMSSEGDDAVTDNSLSSTTNFAVKRKGDVDKQTKQKDDKMETKKEETSLIRDEIVKKEEEKELERKVMKEMENEEEVKDKKEEMKEVKKKEVQKETKEVRKQVKKEEMKNEKVEEEKRKEEIQKEDSDKEEKQKDEVVRLIPENGSVKDESNEVNGETVKDENKREEE